MMHAAVVLWEVARRQQTMKMESRDWSHDSCQEQSTRYDLILIVAVASVLTEEFRRLKDNIFFDLETERKHHVAWLFEEQTDTSHLNRRNLSKIAASEIDRNCSSLFRQDLACRCRTCEKAFDESDSKSRVSKSSSRRSTTHFFRPRRLMILTRTGLRLLLD